MNVAPISRTDGKGFAVIRNYEPTRIERELLAQVFDVISHGRGQRDDELDHAPATTIGGMSEVAVDASPHRGLSRIEIAQRESLEPAA